MTCNSITRRQFALQAAGLVAASTAALPAWAAAQTEIRMLWWGAEDRARRTNEAVALFEQAYPDTSVGTEYMGWDDYWTRLATQVAGGNAPDLMQMDYRYMFEYAGRGAIMPLDQFLGKELKIEDFGAVNLQSCSVDGKLYGANVGVNAFGTINDPALWQQAGLAPPGAGMDWDSFTQACMDFTKSAPSGISATADASGSENLFEIWLRQRGRTLYTDAGELGYGPEDAAQWFAYWADMREAGACVRPDVQALYKNTIETSPLVTKKAASDFAWSNQFVGYQGLYQAPLTITPAPELSGGPSGQYLKPSQMLSISARSKHPEVAAELANFLVRDPRGALILGVERGVPAAQEIRDKLRPTLDPSSAQVVEFISQIGTDAGPLPPAPPQGAGENNTTLMRISQEVGFGARSPEEAGEKLVKDATRNIARG
ncbi:carbohydrate ABC transporter substrate-binding protein [Rhodobacteraceae bacterium]|nr:carbohydrate ABC transporter substrate-binding protein [Paracoccaceae bacterium]